MTLRLRLLLTNVLVLALGLVGTGAIAHSYKAYRFPHQIHQTEVPVQMAGTSVSQQEGNFSPNTIQSFVDVNNEGTVLSLSIGLLITGAISLWTTYSILRPLKQIEQAAKQFNAGNLNARVPASHIPEIHQLGLTLNSVANRLQGVEERRQSLIGDLAHEMATPLTVIRGYLEMLECDKMQLTPAIGRELNEEAERMTRLLEDLRVLSSIEAGSLSLRLQPLYPLPTLQQTIALFKARGWQNQCSLELDCPDRLPMIFVDGDRFKQILTNLIGNALEYTPEGTVTVRAFTENNFLWIQIMDTGIGISSEDLPHVFERFWRSKGSRHLRLDGSGIGLAITQRLVDVMGGQIKVESQLEQGTCFTFSLPLVSGKPPSPCRHLAEAINQS